MPLSEIARLMDLAKLRGVVSGSRRSDFVSRGCLPVFYLSNLFIEKMRHTRSQFVDFDFIAPHRCIECGEGPHGASTNHHHLRRHGLREANTRVPCCDCENSVGRQKKVGSAVATRQLASAAEYSTNYLRLYRKQKKEFTSEYKHANRKHNELKASFTARA
jgi:hypothetical protein